LSVLEAWIRSTLPLHPTVLAQAVELARRAAADARMSEDAWCERLQADAAERDRLLATVVPPETWLFRHAPAFETLRTHLHAIGPRPVRIASLGCATGAEAFSLAATALACGHSAASCEIVAVDWSAESLARAATGTCTPLAQRGPLPAWTTRHFQAERNGSLRLSSEGMAMIRWVQDDITGGRMPRDADVVFCRNVAIYLDDAARERLARNLAAATREDGLLCLGHADPPAVWSGAFRVRPDPGAFAFERASSRTPARNAVPPRGSHTPFTTPRHAASMPPTRPSLPEAQALADAGALHEASAILEQVLRTDAVDPSAWQLRGSVQLALGARDEAEACFRKVVYLQPDHALALLQLSVFADDRGDVAGAERLRVRAVRALRNETS
jgi:chemotaxis protein methyltransferase WspC